MKLLEHAIYSNKPKNVDIFPLAEKVFSNLKIYINYIHTIKFRFVVEHMVFV